MQEGLSSSRRQDEPWHQRRFLSWRSLLVGWRALFPTVALVALALGMWGFRDLFARPGDPRSGLDCLYYALSLFVFEGGHVEGDIPIALQVARLLAPLALAGAAFETIMRYQQRFMIRMKDDHVIIVGLNERSLRLARQLLDTRKRECVLVETDEVAPGSASARLLGIPVVGVGRTDEDTKQRLPTDLVQEPELVDMLERAGVRRADAVVVMTGSADLNVRFAHVLLQLQEAGHAPRTFVEIDDVAGVDWVMSHPLFTRGGSVEWFNLGERAAKSLLDRLDVALAVQDGPTHRHLVIVGRTPIGRSAVVQAARNWHRDLGRRREVPNPHDRLIITLLDAEPGRDPQRPIDQEARMLNRRDPRVPLEGSPVCELHVSEWDPYAGVPLYKALVAPPTAVIVTAADERELLDLSLAVTVELGPNALVWVCAERSGGLVDLVAGRPVGSGGPRAQVFHVLDTVLREDGIRRGVDEELARAVHQAHRRYRRETGTDATGAGTLVPWDQLNPANRYLNHEAVAGWRRVVQDAGYRFVPYRTLGAESVELPDELAENVARELHAVWNDAKKRQGYRHGPARNDDRSSGPLTHPDVDVPFDDLPGPSRQWNVTQAHAIAEHLAAAGLQLDPLPRPAAGHGRVVDGANATGPTDPAAWPSEVVEKLAEAYHELYRRQTGAAGRSDGDGDGSETMPSVPPWEALPETARESNRGTARSLPHYLDLMGYVVRRAPDAADVAVVSLPPEAVERGAAAEHDRWVQEKERQGYVHGPARADDASPPVHPDLAPWDELDEATREKDRVRIREAPRLLAELGYEVVPRPRP